jgi:two-component system, sensor histidine kinase
LRTSQDTEMRHRTILSIRTKITFAIMVTTFAALCVAGFGFAEYGVYRFKHLRMQDLNALANVLGTNSTAPLVFRDPKSARDVLRALGAKPHILAACIYDRHGRPFATYHQGNLGQPFVPPRMKQQVSHMTGGRVFIYQDILFEGKKVGTVFLESDTADFGSCWVATC